jgi:outer membrane beta-barrel protein
MKRPAIGFCLGLAIVLSVSGWAGVGHAKGAKTSGSKSEAAPAAADGADAPAAESAAPAAEGAAPAGGAAAETVTPEGGEVTPEGGEITPPPPKDKALTTLSWQDIVVVPRKAFLKGGRAEFAPFSGITLNDNLIRHYVFGGAINFFLSDVFSIGVEGQYFVKAFTETEENVGLQFNRIPTLNRYLYGGSLNFGYVPIYGKFSWFNKQIMQWEIYANAGFGVTMTEIIPRNPGLTPWTNTNLTVPVGLGARFFLFNWLTVNFAVRDYIMPDKFEPQGRLSDGMPVADDPGATWSLQYAKDHADSAIVNNIVAYVGVGIYLPAKFTYKTPR